MNEKVKNNKMVRVYAPSIETKWTAFVIHARSQGQQPGHLLGEIFLKYYVDNLEEIIADISKELDLRPPE